MQEVIDFLIFRHLHLHLPSVYVKVHIISNIFERNELYMWLISRFGSNHYVFTPCTRDHHRWGELFVLPKSWKHLLEQTMMDEYAFEWLPTSLQCITALNMSMAHSQYLFLNSMNSGIVNTGISEFRIAFLWEFVNGLTHKLGFGEKGC